MISGDHLIGQGKKNVFYYMLEEFSKHWDKISVICMGQGQPSVIHGNVFLYPSGTKWPGQTTFIKKKGAEILAKEKYDLMAVHSYPPFYNDRGAWFLRKKYKVPYVLEVMHVTGHPMAADKKEYISKVLMGLFVRFSRIAKNCLAFRTVNNVEVPQFLMKRGVPQEKILYLCCAYTRLDVFKPNPQIKKDGQTIVYCGRLAQNKGLRQTIKAFKIVADKIPQAKLLIAGDGPLRERLQKQVADLGLANSVEFLGFIDQIKTIEVYNRADLFVLASFNEGAPRAVLEAMACACPTITTKIGLMKEIIREKENGLFTSHNPKEMAEQFLYLLENPKEREQIGQAAFRTAQDFEFKKLIKNYALAYQAKIKGEQAL